MLNRAEREIADVRGDGVEALGRHFEIGPEQFDDRAGVRVVNDLANDAVGAETRDIGIRRLVEQAREDLAHGGVVGADDFFDDAGQGFGGLRHFVNHNAEMAGAPGVGIVHAEQHGGDHEAQGFFGGFGEGGGVAGFGIACAGSHGVAQDGEVEAGFIAEMVVDGGDVGSRAGADVADGGGLEAVFGEDLASGIDEAGAGSIVIGNVCGLERSRHLKQQIKTNV